MNQGPQSCFGRFEKPSFCRKNQQATPRSKKKTWWIHELINQVDRREAAGSQTAEKSEFWGLEKILQGLPSPAGERHKPSASSQKDQWLNENWSNEVK
jgi:hypothetical protein